MLAYRPGVMRLICTNECRDGKYAVKVVAVLGITLIEIP